MSAAAKALDALMVKPPDPPSERWLPAIWVETDGEAWAAIGPVRAVIEPDDGDETGKAATLARRDAQYLALAVNLSAPLAAVARAVADRPWWRNGYEDESGDEISRCEGCQADLDEDRGHSACHDIECRYLDSDRAIDALEAAAAEGGASHG